MRINLPCAMSIADLMLYLPSSRTACVSQHLYMLYVLCVVVHLVSVLVSAQRSSISVSQSFSLCIHIHGPSAATAICIVDMMCIQRNYRTQNDRYIRFVACMS